MFEKEVKDVLSVIKGVDVKPMKPSSNISKLMSKIKVTVMNIKNPTVRRKLDSSFAEVTRLYKGILKDPSKNNFNKLRIALVNLAKNSKVESNNNMNRLKASAVGGPQPPAGAFQNIDFAEKIVDGFMFFLQMLFFAGVAVALWATVNIIINLLPLLLAVIQPILFTVVFIFIILPYTGVALYGMYFASKGKFGYYADVLTETMKDLYKSDWTFNTMWKLLKYAALITVIVATAIPILVAATGLPLVAEISAMLLGLLNLPVTIGFFTMTTYLLFRLYKQITEVLGFSYFTGSLKAMSETFITVGGEIMRLFYMAKDSSKIQSALERFKDFFGKLKLKGKDLAGIQAEDVINSSLNFSMIKNNVIDGINY